MMERIRGLVSDVEMAADELRRATEVLDRIRGDLGPGSEAEIARLVTAVYSIKSSQATLLTLPAASVA